MSSHQHLLVLCTCPDAGVAERLASGLVEGGLAACASIVPGLTSIYSWEGKIQRDSEVLLLIKTRGDRYPELERQLRTTHPYDLPEIIAVPIDAGLAGYLAWIDANVSART
jgi:periplasmic divalent cation tolerance protein